VSDVTAEEVERERERAHRMLTDARYMPCTHPDHNADCDVFATALAARAREARREALKEARTAVDGEQLHEIVDNECDRGYRNGIEDASGAILALMGPET
jgi:hypothetical protein